ncbi:MAG: DUF393 domain-containing protein [Chitinophagaceae bacterium]|nr:MAG: DUF393 domain-containing protein [Chitinophagaceae bacterium]
MRTLKGHTILYDAVCPMCRLYTGAFIRSGMLDAAGRTPYQELPAGGCPGLDRARAVNEIALVNRATGEVTYGVDSLFKILEHRWPVLRPLFRFRVFAGLMRRAYALVSYNRRLIMPAAGEGAGTAPAFHRGWRAAWIGVAWLLTATLLRRYDTRLEGVIPAGGFWREYLVCGGQLLWQGALVRRLAPRRCWDYLGTMMTVSLAGALALTILAPLLDLFQLHNPWVAAAVFGSVAGLMLAEHLRRCRLLELPWTVSAGWVLYRVLLLFFIL